MRLEDLFGHKVNNIIILTSPITYIALLLVLFYIPFYFGWKFFRLNDVWFILFKLKHLSMMELNSLHSALIRRSLKSNRTAYQKWIDRKAMKEVKEMIEKKYNVKLEDLK